MGMMVFLRIAADITLFSALVGPIAVHYGADSVQLIIVMAALVLSETLSYLALSSLKKAEERNEEKISFSREALRVLSFLPFIMPVAVYFLFGPDLPSAILCGIMTAYTVYLAFTGKYFPDIDQQKVVFKTGIGISAGMVVILLFIQGKEISFSWSIFSGVISIVCSVLLLRALRHEPSAYSRASFQLMNASVIAGLCAAVFGLTRRPVLLGIGTALKTAYNGIAYVVLNAMILIVRGAVFVFGWLKKLFGASDIQPPLEQVPELNMQSGEDIFPQITETAGPPDWLRIIFIVPGIAAALLILYLIFRFISGRKNQVRSFSKETYSRADSAARRKSDARHERGDVRGVRKQYRKYLQYLKNNGVGFTDDLTTWEIGRLAPEELGGEAAEELRKLYIEARYNGSSDRRSEERAKELFKEIRSGKNSD